MKKKLLAFTGLLAFSFQSSFAQLNWDNTDVNTHTTHNVGIGLTAVPFDAKLHVFNEELICGGCPFMPSTRTELRLSRKIRTDQSWPFGYISPNYIEVWQRYYDHATNTPMGPDNLKFVLDNNIYMGLNMDKPLDRFHMHDGGILMTSTSDASPRNIYAATNQGSLNLFAKYAVSDGPGIELKGASHSSTPGEIQFTKYDRGNFVFGKYDPIAAQYRRQVVIDATGDINMVRWYDDASARLIKANSAQSGLQLFSNTSSSDGSGIEMYSDSHPYKGSIHFVTHQIGDPGADGFDFVNYNGSTWGSRFKIVKNGNLWLNGFDNDLTVNGNLNKGRVCYNGGTSSTDGAAIELVGTGNSTYSPGSIMFVANTDNSNHTVSYNFQTHSASVPFESRMRVYKDGKVAIGTQGMSTPNGYKLFVEEGILTERLKVAVMNLGNWMDCVFDEDYELRPLEQVEAYISANNHLPDVPSAEEMVKNGLDVATMDATLLQKIEELTLYVIDLKKQNDSQTKEINELKTKLK